MSLLSELTIIDLTEGAAGPFATKCLADFCAHVIKVERPGSGDPARRDGPRWRDRDDAGPLFLFLNAGKESITLDITATTGRSLLLELAEHADAVVESFPPGYLETRGIGPDDLRRRSPRLAVTSLSAFGQSGPYASRPWTDITAFAAGGLMSITGEPDRPPLMTAGHQASYQLGLHAFGATLAGLYSVGVIDRGQHVDLAAMECMAATLELYLGDYTYNGREVLTKRRGNMISPLIGIYPCADGYAGFHILPRNFASFARLLGEEWLLEDERFKDEPSRLRNGDELSARIYAWAADRSRAEIYEAAGRERCTVGPVLTIPDVLADEHFRERETFVNVEGLRHPGPAFRSPVIDRNLRAAPRLGHHNAAVYGGLLGLEARDLMRLRAAAVI
jgi:crotonobetainyl-CoA:carnitine CoA-transferase CaiB-like acyl-CoA transferase